MSSLRFSSREWPAPPERQKRCPKGSQKPITCAVQYARQATEPDETSAQKWGRDAHEENLHLILVQDDYQRFLAEYSLTESSVSAVVSDMRDHVEMPPGYDSFALGRSPIHGLGLFCTIPVAEGTPVAMARVDVCRTVAGRLTNHSPLPNCRFEPTPEGLVMVSRRTLTPGEELTVDYRQAGSVNGWGLEPTRAEVATTLRWRALALRRLGNPWARWCEASEDELIRDVDLLLGVFAHLPSIDLTPVEKQSKETE